MLSDLERQQLDLERRLQTAEKTRGEAERSRERARRDEAEAGRALKDLGRERRRVLREAHGEAASLVADTRREVERLLSRARERPGREDAREMRRRIEQRREALEEGLRQTQERPEPPLRPGDLKPGDRVWVEFLKDHGRVAALSDDGRRAMIEVGRMRVELGIEDLCRPRPDAQPPAAPTPAVALAAPRHADVPAELNLIGQRVEEAVARLEQYLDAAILAQRAEVRIIHGYGTGALRKAVHAFLQTAPVTGFRLGEETRDPGGAGVTIVTL
jgi:DNA mismatch repair protein MutS2